MYIVGKQYAVYCLSGLLIYQLILRPAGQNTKLFILHWILFINQQAQTPVATDNHVSDFVASFILTRNYDLFIYFIVRSQFHARVYQLQLTILVVIQLVIAVILIL